MCIGETTSDTLDQAEQTFLAEIADSQFPGHRFALRNNDDGITWVLLTPRENETSAPFRVTICRVDPCIMVMLEDRAARRQFRALSNVAEAVDFVHAMSDQLLLAAAGRHEAALSLQ